MNKNISPKVIALTFGILTISFLAAFYVVAWQEPTQAPPGGNVPTPLNIGSTGQLKTGWLATLRSFFIGSEPSEAEKGTAGVLRTTGGAILNTGGAETGLIVQRGKVSVKDIIDDYDNPAYYLNLEGNSKLAGDLIVGQDFKVDSSGIPSWQGRKFIGWAQVQGPSQKVCMQPSCPAYGGSSTGYSPADQAACTNNCDKFCKSQACTADGLYTTTANSDVIVHCGAKVGDKDAGFCVMGFAGTQPVCHVYTTRCGSYERYNCSYECLCNCPSDTFFWAPVFE